MALAVAERLAEFVDAAAEESENEQDTKKKDLLYHFGHDFLKEVAEIIAARATRPVPIVGPGRVFDDDGLAQRRRMATR
jgi:hypothetical protein